MQQNFPVKLYVVGSIFDAFKNPEGGIPFLF